MRSQPDGEPDSASRQDRLQIARDIVRELLGPPERRSCTVTYWDGLTELPGVPPGMSTFVIRRPEALRQMLVPPSELSFCEAFLRGDVDILGDLPSAVRT